MFQDHLLKINIFYADEDNWGVPSHAENQQKEEQNISQIQTQINTNLFLKTDYIHVIV